MINAVENIEVIRHTIAVTFGLFTQQHKIPELRKITPTGIWFYQLQYICVYVCLCLRVVNDTL